MCLIFLTHAGYLQEASLSSDGLKVHRAYLAVSSCLHWLPEGVKHSNDGRHTGVGQAVSSCLCLQYYFWFSPIGSTLVASVWHFYHNNPPTVGQSTSMGVLLITIPTMCSGTEKMTTRWIQGSTRPTVNQTLAKTPLIT